VKTITIRAESVIVGAECFSTVGGSVILPIVARSVTRSIVDSIIVSVVGSATASEFVFAVGSIAASKCPVESIIR